MVSEIQLWFSAMGCSKKDHNPPTEEIFAAQRGGRDYLKNDLNLYRMSREGQGVLLISLGQGERENAFLFWNDPFLPSDPFLQSMLAVETS